MQLVASNGILDNARAEFRIRNFDQIASLIAAGSARDGASLLVGLLNGWKSSNSDWDSVKSELRCHPVHSQLLQDPYVWRTFFKPRNYAGDADTIDFAYFHQLPPDTSELGQELFAFTTTFQASTGVRLRKEYAARELIAANSKGDRILSLACGHFREGAALKGQDLSNITVVDQDPLSLAVIREDHDDGLSVIEANAITFLRSAAQRGEKWDYIYTLGLTDYFEDRVMSLFHQLLAKVLSPGGKIMLANFVPDHLAIGWMEAVMDWHLIYRTEEQLAEFAREAGLKPATWLDETGSIAFCEMRNPNQ